MKDKLYLITGATGHLGSNLIKRLQSENQKIRVLVLQNDISNAPDGVEICIGDVTDIDSMRAFFDVKNYKHTTLIHCASLITIASKINPRIWDVNLEGTRNIMDLAKLNNIERIIYVSTVHAIKETEGIIEETNDFSKDYVVGQYAKTKAEATKLVLDYCKQGLNASVVHPSGIIGPGDSNNNNHSVLTIKAMNMGKIPCGIKGGYDFVDVRDIVDGILKCEEKGLKGECYILSGEYISVIDLLNIIRKHNNKKETRIEIPYSLVKMIAPFAERLSILFNNKHPLLTPYSLFVLNTNSKFSHKKASNQFNYQPRDIKESIIDSL